MLEIASLEDIVALRESVEVECKLAQGRDGKGALPWDFWETYSAFANTQGVVASTLAEEHDSEYGAAHRAQNYASHSFDASPVDNGSSFVDNAVSSVDNDPDSVDNERYDENGRLLTPSEIEEAHAEATA
ncbi:MAG: hypothetical protein P3W96_001975 [Halomonas sp.]|nr:hypothetical protein [Halomonas sp.]MDM7480772.1 hypothetical protein [Halomonas sp.]